MMMKAPFDFDLRSLPIAEGCSIVWPEPENVTPDPRFIPVTGYGEITRPVCQDCGKMTPDTHRYYCPECIARYEANPFNVWD